MRFQTIHSFLDKQLEFEINICGMANHDSTWLEELSKPTYAVWIVDEGNVCITYNNQSYSLNKGDTFLFRPDVNYKAYTKSDSGCSFLYILFEAHVGGSNTSSNILMTEGMVEAKYVATETEFVFDCFEKYTRTTPFKYISSLRLKKAYEYIGAMGYSVRHTSELLGYSDQYVFSKAFKRKYRFSPSRIQCPEKSSGEQL